MLSDGSVRGLLFNILFLIYVKRKWKAPSSLHLYLYSGCTCSNLDEATGWHNCPRFLQADGEIITLKYIFQNLTWFILVRHSSNSIKDY
jgi:hypothetical protein